MMLARTADSLYWIGRYVERAEHVSRLADVLFNASLDQSDAAAETSRIVMAAIEQEVDADISPLHSARALVFDRDNPSSVVSSLAWARENARQMRDQITTEMWEQLNALHLTANTETARNAFDNGAARFLHQIVADIHLFKGAAEATMSHGEGWRFLSVGVYIERAQLIARLLEVAFGEGAKSEPVRDHLVQMSLLRMACALEPYLRAHSSDINPRNILNFVLFDEEFPRSIRFVTAQMEELLKALSRHGEAAGGAPERLAGRLSSLLEFADPEEMAETGADEILRTVTDACDRIHEAIRETFVAYPIERRLPA
jgi:uncharacterized alpha-E superfamily protein